VFVSGRFGNTSNIVKMDANGDNEVLLTNYRDLNGFNNYPCWSPDGTQIAFVTNRDGNPEIYVMNADGTDPTRITNNQFGDSYITGSSWVTGHINPPNVQRVPTRWYLNSAVSNGFPVMEKTGMQTGSVSIPAKMTAEDSYQIWLADQPAIGDIIFPPDTWTLRLNSSDWSYRISAQVGEWDGTQFKPFNLAPDRGQYSYNFRYFTFSAGGTIGNNHYLAIKIFSSDVISSHTIVTEHDSFLLPPRSTSPPVAANDTFTTNEDEPLQVAAPGVLVNDSDADKDPLTAVKVGDPTHGSVTINTDGSFTYTPLANYNGSDSFTYKANDGLSDSNTATVTITVNPVNDPPVAAPDSFSMEEDRSLIIAAPGILANDTDVDSNTLTTVLVTNAVHGSLAFNIDGSFAYTPALNYNGNDSFTYKANDTSADSNTATDHYSNSSQ
jgi:VCBS repeat-containing protein